MLSNQGRKMQTQGYLSGFFMRGATTFIVNITLTTDDSLPFASSYDVMVINADTGDAFSVTVATIEAAYMAVDSMINRSVARSEGYDA